ncbi:MAG: hypothetical protein WC474_10010 [Hydrogenophilaceae bacterium]
MARLRPSLLVALSVSLVLHAGLLVLWTVKVPQMAPQDLLVRFVEMPVQEKRHFSKPSRPTQAPEVKTAPVADVTPLTPAPERVPASMPAPPPPSAEEWKLATTYRLRNSKRYRHTWGQQVRSMMGTAVEGPDQGLVRFRIEIAPDGTVAKVEELWSTSEAAAKLAWQAIRSLPPLPPTPTGKPLVFEQTIAFLPYETGWPPSYRLDCLPEPEAFKNPFAWDGASPRQGSPGNPEVVSQAHRPPPPEDCIPDSTADSIEEEDRELQRQMDQWRWGR